MVNDAELVAALASDLDGAFESLVLAYQDRLFGFAFNLAGSRPDAEEIAQDAFMRAYRALQGYQSTRVRDLQLRAWLFQITVNVFRNRVRRRRVQNVSLDGVEQRTVSADHDSPESSALRNEERQRVRSAVAALPSGYREAVMLRHVYELSYEEAATVLKQPVGTVKSNVHRGLKLLRGALAPVEPQTAPPLTAPGVTLAVTGASQNTRGCSQELAQ